MNQSSEQKDILIQSEHHTLHLEVQNLRSSVSQDSCGIPMSIIQKVTQISKALHLVTKHVDDTDPICTSLRKASVDILVQFYDVVSVHTNHELQVKKIDTLNHNLFGAVSFVQVACVSGCISVQNALIIEKEILKLIRQLNNFKSTFSATEEKKPEVHHEEVLALFSEPESLKEEKKEIVSHSENPEKAERQYESKQQTTSNLVSSQQNFNEKPLVAPKEIFRPVPQSVKSFSSYPVVEKDNDGIRRQALITKLVKEKQEVTIKDISSVLPTVSEKTLQRDLTSLSEKGLVKKIGERRWAKYLAV